MSMNAERRLDSDLAGSVLLPDDPGYDDARAVWNATIDRRPALIVLCASDNDVVRAIGFAREHSLPLSIRGGGHHIAGNAVCDGGLVIDLSGQKDVEVDPEARRVRVAPGATLADVDRATQVHGLAVPVGINSTTGIAGLTLGGGFGWLSRKHGLTVDSLVAADVITADGRKLTATATENADLFWALRGGGGNFGVVTRFTFALHPVGPDVLSGLVVYPLDRGREILARYRELMTTMPEDANVWVVLRKAPPLPFLPESVHGRPVVVLAMIYTGDPGEGESVLAPFREIGEPLGEHVGVQPFTDWQSAFDPLLTPGARNYWKSHNLTKLADGLFETALSYAENLPSPQCEIFLAALGDGVTRVAPEATAYAHRDAQFVMNVHGRWETTAEDERCIGWARAFFDAAAPYASAGAYINFMTDDETDRVKSAFGSNHARLAWIKRKYDPDNVFRINQNIVPAKPELEGITH